jgi:hypothetical protein
LASIANASAQNPYLIVIGPGVYTLNQQMLMKPFVDIVGSGSHITVLRGSIGSNSINGQSGLIVTADNSRIQSLGIENLTAGKPFCFGVKNQGTNNKIIDVRIKTSGCIFSIGIRSTDAQTLIRNAHISGITSSNTVGIDNFRSTLDISETNIVGSAVIGNTGVRNSEGLSVISKSTITVSGGNTQRGVQNLSDTSSVRIFGSRISASSTSGSTNNTSLIANSGFSVHETFVSDSFLQGDVTGSPVCFFVFEADGDPLGPTCKPVL